MVTPGLLPEADDRRPSPTRWTLALAFVALLLALGWLLRDRGRLVSEYEAALAAKPRVVTLPAPKGDVERIALLEATIAELRKSPPAPPPADPPPAPARAPDVRVLPPELAAERLTQGLHEFRSGRYLAAEAYFLRAIPEGFLYLALSSLARGDVREAALFLARAMREDPQWLRRVRPRDLFGSAEEYERVLEAAEQRAAEDPQDHEAKTLLAYLHYHEKGAEHAKALLTEVAAARPGDDAPKAFLEALEKP